MIETIFKLALKSIRRAFTLLIVKTLRFFLAALFLAGMLSPTFSSPTQFRRSAEFGPIRMTYADFSKLILKIQKFVRKANSADLKVKKSEPVKAEKPEPVVQKSTTTEGKSIVVSTPTELKFEEEAAEVKDEKSAELKSGEPTYDSLTLVTEHTSLILTDDYSRESFADVTTPSFSVLYSFQRPGESVSNVTFNFGDYKREVIIEGASREEVDALFGMIAYDVGQYESGLGGYTFRFYGAMFMIACGLILVFGPFAKTRLDSILLRSIGTLLIVTVWLPWKDWMPGTALYNDEASFFKRNSAIIGVFLTIALPLLGRAFQVLYRHSRHLDLTSKRHRD